LRVALEENDANAVEIGNKFAQQASGDSYAAEMAALLKHLGDYDFDGALEVLDGFKQAMNDE
jgi:hypothetical protein